jgi:hypothetical protein
VGNVWKIINKDQCSTILEIAVRSGILHGTCQSLRREDLNMHEICMKNVSQLLTDDQKQLQLWPLETWLHSHTLPIC